LICTTPFQTDIAWCFGPNIDHHHVLVPILVVVTGIAGRGLFSASSHIRITVIITALDLILGLLGCGALHLQ
jgi:hypothetical protein